MKTRIFVSVFVILLVTATGINLNIHQAAAVGPQITGVSPTTQTLSGRLVISGIGFGADGQVLVGGLNAPVADWSDTSIVAYIPESVALGTQPVEVVSGGVNGNIVTVQVTARTANGRVKWRFQHNGAYTIVRPAIGPDGSIYVVDVSNHLYALTPQGGLIWIARNAGNKGVSVGSDGTIYTGTQGAGGTIKAYNPNGTLKWTFIQDPAPNILLGPDVGPDGNIYAVGIQGMGVFSLTPAGQLRWAQPESFDRPLTNYEEVVFGSNGEAPRLTFLADRHLRTFGLDGSPGYTVTVISSNQPAFASNGTIYTTFTFSGGSTNSRDLTAYNADGSVKWAFLGQPTDNGSTPPDSGFDSSTYFVQNLSYLYAVNPDGSQRWLVNTAEILNGPVVDPTNSQVGLGGQPGFGISGFFESFSTSTHQQLWRVNLSDENGGQLVPDSRPRFSNDGKTMYITAQIPAGDPNNVYGYVYALDASSGSQPAPTPTPVPTPTPMPPISGCMVNCLRSTSITFTSRTKSSLVTVTGSVTVKDEKGNLVSGATVFATWTLPHGSMVSQTAMTDSTGVARFSTTNKKGTYTLTVDNIIKTGYTFDPTNSVLSGSFTR